MRGVVCVSSLLFAGSAALAAGPSDVRACPDLLTAKNNSRHVESAQRQEAGFMPPETAADEPHATRSPMCRVVAGRPSGSRSAVRRTPGAVGVQASGWQTHHLSRMVGRHDSSPAKHGVRRCHRLATWPGSGRLLRSTFLVPGLGHCTNRDHSQQFGQYGETPARGDPERDILAALERWVESGIAPEHPGVPPVSAALEKNSRQGC
jgi:hypothetical protein